MKAGAPTYRQVAKPPPPSLDNLSIPTLLKVNSLIHFIKLSLHNIVLRPDNLLILNKFKISSQPCKIVTTAAL